MFTSKNSHQSLFSHDIYLPFINIQLFHKVDKMPYTFNKMGMNR